MESRSKTRNQSLYEYLEALQLEFIQTELRRKIYSKAKDKKFWEKVLVKKEAKIKDISSRNGLPSIFNNDAIKAQYRSKIFNETGIPNFFYKNDIDKYEFELKDFKYYFSSGSEVKVITDIGKITIGKISKQPKLNDTTISIKFRGEEQEQICSIEYVTRIL